MAIMIYTPFLLLGAHLVICCDQKQVNKSGLCNFRSQSCYMQLPSNFSPEDCNLTFEKNTPGCLSQKIPIEETEHNTRSIQLRVYQYNNSYYALPAFNVTMTNITWNALNLKFTVGNESVCIGIDINKSKHLPPEWSIFYDCPWYSQLIEGQRVLLEYIATGNEYKEARRFSFITPATMKIDPCNKSIKSHETLTYVDLTFRPEITLHIQKLPAHLQVQEYEVKQCFCSECSSQESLEDCVHVLTVETESEDHNYEIIVPIHMAEEFRNFFYVVYANSNTCENKICYISRTETLTNRTLNGIVMWLFLGFILLLYLLTTASVLWKRYVVKLSSAEAHNRRHHTLLLLHQPLHSVHIRVVTCLAQFLQQHCNVDVLLDIRDIPQTEHKDPVCWYNSKISSLDFAAIISSPPGSDGQGTIYKDLHIVGLHFMKELLRSETSKTELFTIMLPYCNETGIPVLARHLKCIHLMQDIDSMIHLIHGDMDSLCGRYIIRQTLIHEIHNSLETHGRDLKNSIAEMENIIKENGKNGCVLKGPVLEELKSSMETKEKQLSLEKLVFDITNSEDLCDGKNAAQCHDMNYDYFSISDMDLTGLEDSLEMTPRKSQCGVQSCEFCCDDLKL